MANDLNIVSIVGRLTRDSEIKYIQNGGAFVRFSLAVNRRKRNGDRWEDESNFFDCVFFGKAAEAIHQYLTKGRQVAINGELRQSRWEADGQTRSRVEIVVNSLQLLSSGNSTGERPVNNSGYNNNYSSSPRNDSYSQNKPKVEDFDIGPETYGDDDIPF